MDIARARYLVSDSGQAAVRANAGVDTSDPLRLATELRRSLPADEAAAVAEQLTLRERARRNHGRTDDWLYTSEGLEMLTHPLVAERRARRLASLGLSVVDLPCGLGGDLAPLVGLEVPSTGMDRDTVHAMLAARNTGACIARGDAANPPFDVGRLAVLLDPSRRKGGTRRFSRHGIRRVG